MPHESSALVEAGTMGDRPVLMEPVPNSGCCIPETKLEAAACCLLCAAAGGGSFYGLDYFVPHLFATSSLCATAIGVAVGGLFAGKGCCAHFGPSCCRPPEERDQEMKHTAAAGNYGSN